MVLFSCDYYFNNVDKLIKQVNSLNKNKDTLKTLSDRVDLLLLCMTLIEKCQNNFLEFKQTNKNVNPHDIIGIDYKISEYANRLYSASLKVVEVFIKYATTLDKYGISIKQRTDFLMLSKKMLCISARWDIERCINVYEFDIPNENKAFPKRKPLLQDVIFYANRMNATKLGIKFEDGIMPKRIIFAVQPNSGKSFVVNVYSLISLCMHAIYYNTSGILRLSNNGTNACGFSDQIKAMIENEKIVSIFPEFKKYFVTGKPKILEKSTSEEWKIQNLDPRIRASHFARGRDSAINSVRIFVLLAIDDLSDGFEQMNNDEAHQQMTDKFYVDMKNRKEGGEIPDFIVGTMFNEFDIQNTMINKLEVAGDLITDKNNDNIQYTRDFSTIVIRIDCYDKKGNSIAPELISTEELHEVQDNMKPYQFDLVYRQIRSSREPRIFDWANLKTYKKLPDTLSNTSVAVLDPTRKSGNDYFSMPVFRLDTASNDYYFTNCIYTQKSLGKVSDPTNSFLNRVVRFIIDNKITQFTIENNTSNTLGAFIENALQKYGYYGCKITELFNVSKKGKETKLQRILGQENTIINNIVFPHRSILKPQTEIAQFMEHLTRFDSKENIGKKTNPDDAPDSVAIFSDKYLFNRINKLATISGVKKSNLFRK